MLLLNKNLRVGERFPYAVRVDAVLELIDQLPVRKLEKLTRKGSPLRYRFLEMDRSTGVIRMCDYSWIILPFLTAEPRS